MFMVSTDGLHPSTLLCLEALESIHYGLEAKKALDIGCGKGVLSVITARIWPVKVWAADISPKAVEDAQQTMREEALDDRVTMLRSDGFSNPDIAANAPYDIIFCNLLADTLISVADDVKKNLSPRGFAVLSGILAWRGEDIETLYSGLGFEIYKKLEDSPWCAYVLRHKSET